MPHKGRWQQQKMTLNMDKLLIILWMVYQYTQSLQRYRRPSLLSERKETAQGFHHEANGDFKTVREFNGCDRRKLRMDHQRCSYSTVLT
jgi:hypothetical protein